MKSLALLMLLTGCGGYQAPGEPEAVNLVWKTVFGQGGDAPPIEWLETNCYVWGRDVGSGKPFDGFIAPTTFGGLVSSDTCDEGIYWDAVDVVQLPVISGPVHYGKTVLPHELWHAVLRRRDGNGHPNHDDPGFGKRYGFPDGIVDRAARELDAAEAEPLPPEPEGSVVGAVYHDDAPGHRRPAN